METPTAVQFLLKNCSVRPAQSENPRGTGGGKAPAARKGPPEIHNVSDPITNHRPAGYTNGNGALPRIPFLDNAFATVQPHQAAGSAHRLHQQNYQSMKAILWGINYSPE